MSLLKDKVAIVTGGGQGIGRGIAHELANAGAKLVIADLNKDAADIVATEIEEAGGSAIALLLDVTDAASIDTCVEGALNHYSQINILVNNAGVCPEKASAETTATNFDLCYEVNLKGVWQVTGAITPHFQKRREGKVINIASTAGRHGSGNYPAYHASKAGLINLTQSLAMALGPDNINVNAICPGLVKTPLTEAFCNEGKNPNGLEDYVKEYTLLKRLITPADIGYAAVFFASDDAKNITGQALNVNGGEYLS